MKESSAEQETEVHDNAQTSSATEELEGKADDVMKDSEDKEKDKGKEAEKSKEKDLDRKTEKDKEKVRSLDGGSLDNLLQRLPGCVSRDLIDQLTVFTPAVFSVLSTEAHYIILKLLWFLQVEFCYLNSKASRKKLVRALFSVPRTSLELLPYYSRMIATLSSCMKDVPIMLLPMLEEEFNFLINKKV